MTRPNIQPNLADRTTQDSSTRQVFLHGETGVIYRVTTLDEVDENLSTCNVPGDRDLLLDRRSELMAFDRRARFEQSSRYIDDQIAANPNLRWVRDTRGAGT